MLFLTVKMYSRPNEISTRPPEVTVHVNRQTDFEAVLSTPAFGALASL